MSKTTITSEAASHLEADLFTKSTPLLENMTGKLLPRRSIISQFKGHRKYL
jgi:hypothetical protein